MSGVFVTASGTGVGKTFVMTQLIGVLRESGRRLRVLKPIASGFDPAAPEDSDSGRLLRAQELPPSAANLDAISPWRLRAPLSPDMAARREQRGIVFDAVVDFCAPRGDADITLIEGIGGVMVPLDDTHTVLDWIAALEIPSLLVAGSYLGALSHALTAAAALRARDCKLAAVIVSESAASPVDIEETAGVLARFLAPVPVRALPRTAAARFDWRKIIETFA